MRVLLLCMALTITHCHSDGDCEGTILEWDSLIGKTNGAILGHDGTMRTTNSNPKAIKIKPDDAKELAKGIAQELKMGKVILAFDALEDKGITLNGVDYVLVRVDPDATWISMKKKRGGNSDMI